MIAISAKEARKLMQVSLDNEKTLTVIFDRIKGAARENKNSITVDGRLNDVVIGHLKNLGYIIETGGRYNEIDTNIKW